MVSTFFSLQDIFNKPHFLEEIYLKNFLLNFFPNPFIISKMKIHDISMFYHAGDENRKHRKDWWQNLYKCLRMIMSPRKEKEH